MNTTTTPAASKYQPAQVVEVSVTDFATNGMPRIWVAGTVETVESVTGGLWDVRVRLAGGRVHTERVGKRGGNDRIRVAE